MAKAKEVASQKASVSQEYVSETDSDTSSTASSEAEGLPKTTVTKKISRAKQQTGSETSSDNATSNEDSTSSASETPSKKRKPGIHAAIADSYSKKAKTKKAPNDLSNGVKAPSKIAGYEPIGIDASEFVSGTSSMFASLDNKQIWHITAPASIPITSIKSLDISAALRGEAILHHKGASYNMFAAPSSDETLLLPRGSTGLYSKSNATVSRNFHLREMPHDIGSTKAEIAAPSSADGVSDDEAIDVQRIHFVARKQGDKKRHRQQPRGLLMRYQPYGTGSQHGPYRLDQPEVDGDGEDQTVNQNTLVVPGMESDEDLQATPRKSRKKDGKKPKQNKMLQGGAITDDDAMDIDDTSNSIAMGTPQPDTRKSKDKTRDKSKSEKKAKKHKDKV